VKNFQEVKEKKKRVRTLMSELHLDAVLLRKQCNFSWLTCGGLNLVGIATEMGAASLLIASDKEYVICNNIEATRIEKEEKIPEQGYELRPYPWYDGQEEKTVREITKEKRVGCDSPFPGTTDISKDFDPLRYELFPEEIERYKILGHQTSKAIEAVAAGIKPGDRECTVIGRLAEKLWENRIDYITTFCAADERISQYRHPIPTENEIRKRVMLGVNSRKWGLIVSLTRFVQFGKVPEDFKERYRANVYIDCVFMANTIPGSPVVDTFKKGLAAYAEMGYPEEYKLHHQGGAIGYVGRDYRVNFNTKEIVRENQAFTWNPSITGSKSEDTMLATSDGPVLLSKPVTFPVLTIDVEGRSFNRPGILEIE
jgi:Xaa-Pro dipeptidase